jgi:hypothetical protein
MIGFVVARCDAPPVLEFVEQPFDEIAPAVFLPIMRGRCVAVDLGGDDRLDASLRDLFADGVGVVTAIGEHPEQRPEALHVMRLAGRQHEAERAAFAVAAGVKLG